MLLVPKAQGLVEMLQTIYETESCFSADGMSGREPSLEILPRTPLHSIPVAGKWPRVPTCPQLLSILAPGLSTSLGVFLHRGPASGVLLNIRGLEELCLPSLLAQGCHFTVPPSHPLPHPSSASACSRVSLSC